MNNIENIGLASLEKRVTARVVDFFIVYIVSLGVADLARIAGISLDPSDVNYILWIVLLGYELVSLLLLGGTLGKIVSNIHIVSTNFSTPDVQQLVYRTIAMVVPFEFIIGLFTTKQQCLHDLVARTIVVQEVKELQQ